MNLCNYWFVLKKFFFFLFLFIYTFTENFSYFLFYYWLNIYSSSTTHSATWSYFFPFFHTRNHLFIRNSYFQSFTMSCAIDSKLNFKRNFVLFRVFEVWIPIRLILLDKMYLMMFQQFTDVIETLKSTIESFLTIKLSFDDNIHLCMSLHLYLKGWIRMKNLIINFLIRTLSSYQNVQMNIVIKIELERKKNSKTCLLFFSY